MIALLAVVAHAAPLTLSDAVERALGASLEIRQQRLSADAAGSSWLADPRAGDPSLRMAMRDLEPGAAPRMVTRLRFPLPRPWDLNAAVRQGRASEARESAELDRRSADVEREVTTRFHQVPLLREAAERARELSAARVEHLAIIEQRRDEGLATTLDWLESEEERRDADAELAEIEERLHEDEAELRALCDLPADDPLDLAVSVEDLTAELDTTELVEGLEVRAPTVREAQARLDREQTRLTRARLQSLPWLDWLQGGVHSQQGANAYEIGLAIDVPVYKWGPNRTRADRLAVDMARVELSEERQRVSERVVRRQRAVDASRARFEVARTHRAAITTETASIFELADPLLQVELRVRNARAAYREAVARADLVWQLDQLRADAAL